MIIITRENAKELLPIIKAYSEGKTIQLFVCGEWRDRYILHLEDDNCHYRIKPEPKYRSFKSKEECWEEMGKHQYFDWMKDKYTDQYSIISIFEKSTDFNYLFKNKTFINGTLFGIKEE